MIGVDKYIPAGPLIMQLFSFLPVEIVTLIYSKFIDINVNSKLVLCQELHIAIQRCEDVSPDNILINIRAQKLLKKSLQSLGIARYAVYGSSHDYRSSLDENTLLPNLVEIANNRVLLFKELIV